MRKKLLVIGALLLVVFFVFYILQKPQMHIAPNLTTGSSATGVAHAKTAILANGCFWCVEHDLALLDGVIDVVSGYAGGTTKNPTYENYAEGGHREVVEVTYDPTNVSFANLVEHILKHGDPTDASGSFGDRGAEYAPAIYIDSEEEGAQARRVIEAMNAAKVFSMPISIAIAPRVQFWSAEEYHQDYAEKNPIRYTYYRNASGRDAFIEKHWSGRESEFTFTNYSPQAKNMSTASTTKRWEGFIKPSKEALRQTLTPIQYKVTQEDGTERPFDNLYDKNYEEGIYVDIVSGEPLYSSKDKFDSGTGWPSFVRPIKPDAVALREGKQLFTTRTEARSRFSDNHLGHVFDDGPVNQGGMRYCMNSAALRFVPIADMERGGYGEYISLFNK